MSIKTKAVIFDLDGTLLNTLDDIYASVNHTMEVFSLPTHTKDEVRSYLGNGAADLVARAVPMGKSNPRYEEIFAYYRKYYGAHAGIRTCPYDGIMPLLEALKEKGVLVGIASNKHDDSVKTLARDIFGALVDYAVGESERVRIKPAPDILVDAMTALGVTAEETLYVGDSEVDILTGKAANVRTVGVTWGFRDAALLKETGAQWLADHPSELLAHVKM